MSIVYFSNNADNGDGSLRATIASAQPGDVIRPDESVFERGSTIEIVLASQLNVDKNLTLDASPFRVRLDGGGAKTCATIASGVIAEFTAFDFVRGFSAMTGGCVYSSGTLTLNRCGVYGGSAMYAGGVFARYGLTLNDCVVAGCRASESGGGLTLQGESALNGVAIIGNAAARGADVLAERNGRLTASNSIIGVVRVTNGAPNPTYIGTVANVAPSSVGFVASPPDDLTVENWSANAWQNWDLRLLDDASGAPSPYRDSGDVDAASKYDLDGNFRGRETNGASMCSPGAYETIQADLFWIGRDATGAEVVAPSFLTSDGWATSRFADVSGDAAPQAGQTVFVDGAVAFVDVLPTSTGSPASVVVGGLATIDFGATTRFYLAALQVGVAAVLNAKATSATAIPTFRFGAWSQITGGLAASIACEFDVNTRVATGVFYNSFISPVPTYGSLTVAPSTIGRVRLDGVYICDSFKTTYEGTSSTRTIKIGDAATIRAKSATFGANATAPFETLFDKRVAIALQGDAKTTVSAAAPQSWAAAFEVDLSQAASATLTLNGQTIYGAAPTAAVSLTGSAKIDERGLDVATLTLNADASLTVETATLNAESLILTADTTLTVDGGNVNVAELSVADGATVAFSGTDVILAATETAIVGAATFSGAGYFASPRGTDLTAATFAEAVRACDYGAGLQTFSATSVGKSINYRWTAENIETPVLIERQVDNAWEVVELHAANGETTFPTESSGNTVYRAFDGETFLQTLIYIAPFHAWLTYDNLFTSAIVVKSYTIVTEHILMSTYLNAGEAPVFLARIADSLTSVPVVPSDVESIALTVYKLELYRGVKRRVTLDGWGNLAVPLTAVMESLIADDPRWNRDSIGYNFRFEPDLREKELFKDAGEYVAVVTMKFKEGNPAPLVFNITIK